MRAIFSANWEWEFFIPHNSRNFDLDITSLFGGIKICQGSKYVLTKNKKGYGTVSKD